ncbi:MAG: transposase [Bacteriovoracaceae bacterium]|jgi:ribosomal protein S12 methylthiotransferase accessory factor YcaO|nr:transposase [Bacteriovoracaceae bacterium]
MKPKKFSEVQIIKALKRIEACEQAMAVCRELGVHEQTYYNWKKKYSGLEVDQLKELKALQDENACLKKIVDHFIDSTGVISWKFFSQKYDYEFVEWDFQGTTKEEYDYLTEIRQ